MSQIEPPVLGKADNQEAALGVVVIPDVKEGDTVAYFQPGQKCRAAYVQDVTSGGLSLFVYPGRGVGFGQAKQVLHKDDPQNNERRRVHNGVWDLTEQEKTRRRELQSLRELLGDEVRSLRDQLREVRKLAAEKPKPAKGKKTTNPPRLAANTEASTPA